MPNSRWKDFPDCVLVWTRGHQDDSIPVDKLLLLTQLNIECDSAAKVHIQDGLHPTKPPKLTKGMKAALVLDNHIITTNMDDQVKESIHRLRLFAYAADKMGWTDEQT